MVTVARLFGLVVALLVFFAAGGWRSLRDLNNASGALLLAAGLTFSMMIGALAAEHFLRLIKRCRK